MFTETTFDVQGKTWWREFDATTPTRGIRYEINRIGDVWNVSENPLCFVVTRDHLDRAKDLLQGMVNAAANPFVLSLHLAQASVQQADAWHHCHARGLNADLISQIKEQLLSTHPPSSSSTDWENLLLAFGNDFLTWFE